MSVIHFDGFSLLLIVVCTCAGYVIGWRRCRAGMRSQIANDASVIAFRQAIRNVSARR